MTTRKDEKRLDETVEESFPASDPPASSGITGPRIQRPADKEPPSRERDKKTGNTDE